MKAMTLTELACVFDLNFRTCLSWINGKPIRIQPTVKVAGKGKKQFSPREQLQFLIARRLLDTNVPAKAVQQFLDFLTECRLLESVIPESVNSPLLNDPKRPEMLTTVFVLTWNRSDKTITAPNGTIKPNEGVFTHFLAEETQKFSDYIAMLTSAGFPVRMIELGKVLQELLERIICYEQAADYKALAAARAARSVESMQKAFAAARETRMLEAIGKQK